MLNLKIKTEKDLESTSEKYVEKQRGGLDVYSDPLFDSVKDFLLHNLKPRRYNIKFHQYNNGTKIVFYQGNPKNIWGFVEVVNWTDVETEDGKTIQEPVYNIRIYSSILKNFLKQEKTTMEFFKDIL